MAAGDVFPPSNLGDNSVEWARQMENLTRNNAYALQNMQTSLTGDNRATAGQMGALGRQISELQDRATVLVSRGSDLIVSSTSTVTFSTASWTDVIPGSGVTRSALISISAPYVQDNNISVLLGVSSPGLNHVSSRAPSGPTLTPPAGWVTTFSDQFVTQVPATGLPLTLTIYAVNFVAGTLRARLVNPTYSVTLFDRVN